MNGRQAARAAAKQIKELEGYNSLCKLDIIAYNECILGMIAHRSPCDWCQDQDECREEGKDLTIGCDMWMLKEQKVKEDSQDDGPGESDQGA